MGSLKILLPGDKLIQMMPIYSNIPLRFVRLLGFFELMAAAGIILPSSLQIAPVLTSVTAAALAVAMAAAVSAHAMRKEYKQAILPVLLFLASALVVILRFQRQC